MDPILIFLAIAVIIIAMAFLLTKVFRKTVEREKPNEDPNGNPRDGDAIATWSGIDQGDNH